MKKKHQVSNGKLAAVESSAVGCTKFYVVAGERQRNGTQFKHFLIP